MPATGPMTIHPTMTPPSLPDAWEGQRQREVLLRTRLMTGDWEQDLERWILNHIGTTRLQGWRGYDLSANPFRVIATQLAALYMRPPTIRNASGSLEGFSERNDDDTAGILERAGLWSTMQTLQANTIACRQYLLRVTTAVKGDKVTARFRPVSPAFIVARTAPEAPDVPITIAEARLRIDPMQKTGTTRQWVWTWDVLDISDPETPTYKVHLNGVGTANRLPGEFLGEDVTRLIPGLAGNLSGPNYPYRFVDGTPHLPYVTYTAQRGSGQLWTPYELRELVRGSLNLAVGWSFFYHCMRDASWPQRFMYNAMPVSSTVSTSDRGDEARAHITTDPATVIALQAIDPDITTTTIGQWDAGCDLMTLAEALGKYAERLAQDAGISASDVQRSTGNARSGYAISLTNQGKREAQHRFREPFAWADRMLMSITAAMVNRTSEASPDVEDLTYPEDGYSIEYAAIPLSPDEMRARDEHVLKMLDARLMSRVEAYMLTHPGITARQAQIELDAIEAASEPEPETAEPETAEAETGSTNDDDEQERDAA